MLLRLWLCAIAAIAATVPAKAGNRDDHAATSDALYLLLQDQRATFGSSVPLAMAPVRFKVEPAYPAGPLPDTIPRFEALMAANVALVPADADFDRQPRTASRFPTLESEPGLNDARRVIAAAMNDYPRPRRRRAVFDTMLTFRLDGQARTRSLTASGVAGLIWDSLPIR